MKRWEWALAAGLCAALLLCAFAPCMPQWWSAAFSPLCGGILTADGGGEIVLRSRLLEWLSAI